MSISIFSIYNNKGGVGKTTLAFNVAAKIAIENPRTQVLVIDMCPQANVSQYLLGGGDKGYQENQDLQSQKSRRNVVGFFDWLLDGNSDFTSIKRTFKVNVNDHNSCITSNVFLIAGDSFLESLSLALNYAVLNPANRFAWKQYMTSIRRLCLLEFDKDKFDKMIVFIDCNPSFSMYTQISLVSSDFLVIPMMADYSSLEGLKGIMTLLYGKYSTSAGEKYAAKFVTFSSQAKQFGLPLPKINRLIFNNYTVKEGVAKAYEALKNELTAYCYKQYEESPELFCSIKDNILSKENWEENYLSLVKDFHTSGKVSASIGIPLYKLPEKENYIMPNGEKVTVRRNRYEKSVENIEILSRQISDSSAVDLNIACDPDPS